MGKKLLLESAMIAAFLITLMAGSFNFAFASYPGPDTDSQYASTINENLEYAEVTGYYYWSEQPPYTYQLAYWYSSRCSIDPFYRTGNLYVHYWTNQINNPYFSPVEGDTEYWTSLYGLTGVTDAYGQTGSYYYVTFPQFFWVQTYTAHVYVS